MTPIEQLSDRELDRAVAEKVMEWHHEGGFYWLDQAGKLVAGLVWSPSTNMAAAWQVVEKMAELGYWCSLKSPFYLDQPCWAGFTPHNTTGWNGRPDFSAGDRSPSRAICLAALRAVTEVDDGAIG